MDQQNELFLDSVCVDDNVNLSFIHSLGPYSEKVNYLKYFLENSCSTFLSEPSQENLRLIWNIEHLADMLYEGLAVQGTLAYAWFEASTFYLLACACKKVLLNAENKRLLWVVSFESESVREMCELTGLIAGLNKILIEEENCQDSSRAFLQFHFILLPSIDENFSEFKYITHYSLGLVGMDPRPNLIFLCPKSYTHTQGFRLLQLEAEKHKGLVGSLSEIVSKII